MTQNHVDLSDAIVFLATTEVMERRRGTERKKKEEKSVILWLCVGMCGVLNSDRRLGYMCVGEEGCGGTDWRERSRRT